MTLIPRWSSVVHQPAWALGPYDLTINTCHNSSTSQSATHGFLYYTRTDLIPFVTLKIRPNYFNVL